MTERLRAADLWVAWVRLGAVPFACLEVGVFTPRYPRGYQTWSWVVTGIFAAGAVVLAARARTRLTPAGRAAFGLVALAFDSSVIVAYIFIYAFEADAQVKALLYAPVVEGAFRFGLAGGLTTPIVLAPFFYGAERFRHTHFGFRFNFDHVTFPLGLQLVVGAIVGRLVDRVSAASKVAEQRAGEAEALRDALGHRVDLLEAANRCSRALASSLDMREAFGSFIRELQGLVPFDRAAIVLAEGGLARVIATAGLGAETVFPAGMDWPLDDSVTEDVLDGQTVLQRDLAQEPKTDVGPLVELGLHSRLAAPLLVGARAIGMLSLTRRDRDAFDPEEVELVSLLGRLVGTAVQNIRVYEAERQTVEELRRLSALRADFVSLVSHELRSPMAAVIGAAQTLRVRWRELGAEQRDAFLALIADETDRLSALIADVLDASRIEAGTFSFAFSDVDVAELVRGSVAAAGVGQDEVGIRAQLDGPLPVVRGDRERLRQVLSNLIDNAVKYSEAGASVEVWVRLRNDVVRIEVRDRGPGIALEQQKLIFEKFGRARGHRPGTGLGLFIARSIAEAHGGTLDVVSALGEGATFVLELPTQTPVG